MKIVLGSDHAGFELKNNLVNYLQSLGHETIDVGTYSKESVDYPDFGANAAKMVEDGYADFGIVICYTGIGISIVANKFEGIRCALVRSPDEAYLTRSHNNSNMLALGAKYTPFDYAKDIVDVFLNQEFSNEEKHLRRINKIKKLEERKWVLQFLNTRLLPTN